ncbi:MAG: T9SS type A sorting domain-containing protein [Bacteroidetes bacterium]|nr:T9SS type A sorting domain-containing protein [Bacteroidota bacterium]
MKKQIFNLAILLAAIPATLWSQGLKPDTITMGPSYAFQVYYDMAKGTKFQASISEWDIAHTTVGRDNCIRANHMTGIRVLPYPKGDSSAWSSVDTTGWMNWRMVYNNMHVHESGAFNQQLNKGNQWDFNWGVYDPGTHIVKGDSFFIVGVQTAPGGPYSKLMKFMPLYQLANGDLVFQYANLDGSNYVKDTLFASTAVNRQYKYYRFSNDTKPVHEPADSTWDISFNRYYTPQYNPATQKFEPYPTMGVESKRGTMVARIYGPAWASVLADTGGLVRAYWKTFNNDLTGIGSDWKIFNGTAFILQDTMNYIVKRVRPGDTTYWLLHFTGFGGSSTGKVMFNTMQLRNTVSVIHPVLGQIKVFPNPAANQLYITIENAAGGNTRLQLMSTDGKVVAENTIPAGKGLVSARMDVSALPAGTYILNMSNGRQESSSRIVIE